ncbi:MAG: hypothetical protein P1U89_05330 [Verrucomicrobiales bacterium]|nr:hypothetical protein [Verrucomicrobiales bacterium]
MKNQSRIAQSSRIPLGTRFSDTVTHFFTAPIGCEVFARKMKPNHFDLTGTLPGASKPSQASHSSN